MIKKISLLMSLLIVAATLTGCGDSTIYQYDESSETSSGYDYKKSAEYMDSDTLIMTVGESTVYWDEYYYWMTIAVKNIVNDYGEIEDWDEIYPDSYDMYGYHLDYNEYVRYFAYDTIIMYRTIEENFNEMGLSISEKDIYTIDNFVEDEGIGSIKKLEEALNDMNMNQELFEYIATASAEYYALLEAIYGDGGQDCPDDEVTVYAESEGYFRVKHILISSGDDAEENAESILAELQGSSGEELEELFDELMNQHSEDAGLEEYPDGYLFKSGDMLEEFEQAAEALNEYELSEVVETSSGYHIILRIPIDLDAIPYGKTDSLRTLAAYNRLDSIISAWQNDVKVSYEDAFDQIVPSEIFVN